MFKIIGYQDLKLWLHGQKVTFSDNNISECNNPKQEACYGGEVSTYSIDFNHKGQYNPVINFLHEFGHLFDNIWAGGSDKDYFTGMLKEVSFYDEDKMVIAGRDGNVYQLLKETGRLKSGKALKSDEVGGGVAWQQVTYNLLHPYWEDWADIFANYKIDNINQNDYLGKQMYNFAYQMETLVFLGGYWKPCYTAH